MPTPSDPGPRILFANDRNQIILSSCSSRPYEDGIVNVQLLQYPNIHVKPLLIFYGESEINEHVQLRAAQRTGQSAWSAQMKF